MAAVNVDVLHLKVQINTIRVFLLLDILANRLAPGIVRSIRDGWGQDTAGVCAEDDILRHVGGVAHHIGLVVFDGFPFLEFREGAAGVLRFCSPR